MVRRTANMLREPTGSTYRALIDYCANRCSQGLLVRRDSIDLEIGGIEVINALDNVGAQYDRRNEWPGTILTTGEATIITFPLTSGSVDLLKGSVSSLYEWQQPEKPEDLALLRGGESMLVTIAHECDAYMLVSEGELDELKSLGVGLDWSS